MSVSVYDMRRRRAARLRRSLRLKSRGGDRPRLSVFRSGRQVYAQVIDDGAGRTLAAASSLERGLREELAGKGSNQAAASAVGRVLAERALAAGVTEVVFDRGAYLYHGRVRALAEAARGSGLRF